MQTGLLIFEQEKTMKKMLAVIVLALISAVAASAVPVTVNTNVTMHVTAVNVLQANILPRAGTISVMAPWQWLDGLKVVYSGCAVYKDSDLAAVFGTTWPAQRAAALALNDNKPWVINITASTNGYVVSASAYNINTVNGQTIPQRVTWSAAQLASAGINVAALQALIVAQAQAMGASPSANLSLRAVKPRL